MAFKYLSWLLYPLFGCYAVYSLIYVEHKGWYSWVLSMLYGFLLTFGEWRFTTHTSIHFCPDRSTDVDKPKNGLGVTYIVSFTLNHTSRSCVKHPDLKAGLETRRTCTKGNDSTWPLVHAKMFKGVFSLFLHVLILVSVRYEIYSQLLPVSVNVSVYKWIIVMHKQAQREAVRRESGIVLHHRGSRCSAWPSHWKSRGINKSKVDHTLVYTRSWN